MVNEKTIPSGVVPCADGFIRRIRREDPLKNYQKTGDVRFAMLQRKNLKR